MGLSSFHGGHSFHGDGDASVHDIAAAAVAQSFSAFGFSEHFDRAPSKQFLPPGETDYFANRGEWTAAYIADVLAARSEFTSDVQIRLGAEVDYIRGQESWTRESLSKWPFEYLVGSVHYMRYGDEDICIDAGRPRVDEALRRAGGPEQLMLDYYDHVLELLDWKLVQIIGHIDLIKIDLSHEEAMPSASVRSRVTEVLQLMGDRSVAIDVNCAGLRKPCKEIYPSQWILDLASRIGVPATLGDDSHEPAQVGSGLEEGVSSLAAAGYKSLWVIESTGELAPRPLPRAFGSV